MKPLKIAVAFNFMIRYSVREERGAREREREREVSSSCTLLAVDSSCKSYC